MIRGIWSPWRNKRGATATITKMVPRQHIVSGSSWRYRWKRSGHERVMQGWWGAPGFRVPTGRRHGKRGTCKDNSNTVRTWASHTTKHSFTGQRLGGYTFEACISERVEFDEGSSGTRAVVEVVVLVTVVEVVVHSGRGSCSGSWRVVV